MKNKGSIFNWFRRKKVAPIKERKEIINTTPIPVVNNEEKEPPIEKKPNFIKRPNRVAPPAVPSKEEKTTSVIGENNSEQKPDFIVRPSRGIPPTIPNKEEDNKDKSEIEIKQKTNINPIDDRNTIANDERDTLIKPVKPSSIRPIIHPKGEDNKDKVEDENKTFDETFVLDDITIKTNTLDEIEKMLRANYHEIQTIQYELEILEEKEQDEVITTEIEKLIDELEKLIKKFEKIKNDFYHNNFEEIYNHPNDDNYINQLIAEYKTSFKDNNLQEATILQIEQIEEYIELINEIINIENKKDELSKTLSDKKDDLEIRDDEFEKMKDEYSDIEKTNNYIETFINEQEFILKNIEHKVNTAENITKKAEYKSELAINYTRLLTSTLLLAATNVLPFTRRGGLLRTGLIAASVIGLASAIRVRTRETSVITNVTFTDYAKEIRSNINSINDMTSMLDNAMLDIRFLKENFIKEFSEYIDVIPEYTELITKLDTIEKDLTVKQELAKEYDRKLEEILDKNNVKVKRLEEEYPN